MENNKKLLSVDPSKLYTKSLFSTEFNLCRNTVNAYIKNGKLTPVPINGTTLVLDEGKYQKKTK